MKQPREDVIGATRDDYLLALEDAAMPHRDALISMTRVLISTCMVGNPAPIVQRIRERISNPQIGDLVVEVSAMSRRSDSDTRIKGFGVLLEHRVEWLQTDEEWAAQLAEDPEAERLTDHAWYVQYGPEPGDVCRWMDCEFVVIISTDPHQFVR